VKLLLDQGLPRGAVAELRAGGHDARHTADLGLERADDGDLLALARASGWTVVTLDADFHALLAMANAATPSVIRVRVEGLRARELAALIHDVVAACAHDLEAGAAVSVDDHTVRVKRLPLVK
jgi:predicted nuclease of predicted toxin-antitoxin system